MTPGDKESRPDILVVGGGPAGLTAAGDLAAAGCAVTVIDRMPSLGRKFLMAGRSGLNLTSAEPAGSFPEKYGKAASWMRRPLDDFSPDMMIRWAGSLGQICFTGTSGRVFPEAMKASPLLRAWLRDLHEKGVMFRSGVSWNGQREDGSPILTDRTGAILPSAPVAATVLATGGASWSRLGSDGRWSTVLASHGVPLAPFRPANCGFRVDWSPFMREKFSGTPLKRIALTAEGITIRGEAVITERGLEGGAVYALSPLLRDRLEQDGRCALLVNLRPDMTEDEIVARLAATRARESLPNRLRKALSLPPVAVALMRENGPLPAGNRALAQLIRAVPVSLTGTEDLDRAISVAGGVTQEAVDDRFMLRAMPGVFACGEMLDWEAPTGGYLLQGVMATGHAAAKGVLEWLKERQTVA